MIYQNGHAFLVTCDHGQRGDLPGTCRAEITVTGHSQLFAAGWRTTAGNWGPVGPNIPAFPADRLSMILTWCPRHTGDRDRRR